MKKPKFKIDDTYYAIDDNNKVYQGIIYAIQIITDVWRNGKATSIFYQTAYYHWAKCDTNEKDLFVTKQDAVKEAIKRVSG